MSIKIDEASLAFARWLHQKVGNDGLSYLFSGKLNTLFDEVFNLDTIEDKVFDISTFRLYLRSGYYKQLQKYATSPLTLYHSLDGLQQLNEVGLDKIWDAWIWHCHGPEVLEQHIEYKNTICLQHFRTLLIHKNSFFWWPEGCMDIKKKLSENSDFCTWMQSLMDENTNLFSVLSDDYFKALQETGIEIDFTSFFEDRDYRITLLHCEDTSLQIPEKPQPEVLERIKILYGFKHTLKVMHHLAHCGEYPQSGYSSEESVLFL